MNTTCNSGPDVGEWEPKGISTLRVGIADRIGRARWYSTGIYCIHRNANQTRTSSPVSRLLDFSRQQNFFCEWMRRKSEPRKSGENGIRNLQFKIFSHKRTYILFRDSVSLESDPSHLKFFHTNVDNNGEGQPKDSSQKTDVQVILLSVSSSYSVP